MLVTTRFDKDELLDIKFVIFEKLEYILPILDATAFTVPSTLTFFTIPNPPYTVRPPVVAFTELAVDSTRVPPVGSTLKIGDKVSSRACIRILLIIILYRNKFTN